MVLAVKVVNTRIEQGKLEALRLLDRFRAIGIDFFLRS